LLVGVVERHLVFFMGAHLVFVDVGVLVYDDALEMDGLPRAIDGAVRKEKRARVRIHGLLGLPMGVVVTVFLQGVCPLHKRDAIDSLGTVAVGRKLESPVLICARLPAFYVFIVVGAVIPVFFP